MLLLRLVVCFGLCGVFMFGILIIRISLRCCLFCVCVSCLSVILIVFFVVVKILIVFITKVVKMLGIK